MSNSDYSVQLVLIDKNTPGTGAPPTFRLELVAQKGLKSGQSLELQVLEASMPGGEAKEIDRFSVRVVQQGANWVFRDVVDLRPETHPVRAGKHCLTDHFQLVFAGADGAKVCILSELGAGISRPAYISVKVQVKGHSIESACAPQRMMRLIRAPLQRLKFPDANTTEKGSGEASLRSAGNAGPGSLGGVQPRGRGIEVRGSEEFKQATLQHIERIRNGGSYGADLIQQLETSKNLTVIVFGEENKATPTYAKYPLWLCGITVAGDDAVIQYNPFKRSSPATYEDGGKMRPPWVALAHEFYHVLDFYSGEDFMWVFERGNVVNGELVENAWEASAVLGGNHIRAENNLPLRKGY
ncbi:MAG TPA: M91 family zinc metallopeptidase [Fibrobacteria bacterium]|nr:M91 family zinc metallopeptidase [Fibrobacteria bacterium]